MRPRNSQSDKFDELREQAVRLLSQDPELKSEIPSDILQLVQELRIHQTELEVQNEELQRARNEMADLQQEYEDLYEFAPCGYVTLNEKGLISKMNLTATRLLDGTRQDLSGLGFSQLIDMGWDSTYWSARRKCAETGQEQSIELPFKRHDNSTSWLLAQIQADRNEAGEAIKWRIVLVDIDDRRKAVVALQKSEARYRKMMDSISDPLCVCSSTRTVEFMNPAMISRVGRNAVGETCYKAIHDLSKACEWCPFDRVGNGETVENTFVSPLDGRNYRVTHMPISNDDGTVSKLSIYRDVQDYLTALAEKEHAQAQLNQAQKMESIGNLVAGIAHDFNNTLFPVVGMSEMLMQDLPSKSVEHRNVEEIHKAGSRAAELVKKLLAFSRRSEHELIPVKLHEVLKDALNLMRATVPANIEIRESISADCGMVMADPTQIHQIVLNLVTNAYHAVEATEGSIGIELKDVRVAPDGDRHATLAQGRYVELAVSDTGTGIDPSVLGRIFEPYFTTKTTSRGTGLGLAVVYGIVQEHGGDIEVSSELGKGSTFSVYLPVTEQSVEVKRTGSEHTPTGNEHILLVDDEESVANVERKMLERLGYEVTFCLNSLDALELYKANSTSFDLVISDMSMPNMTGKELAEQLKTLNPDLPVVVCTGFGEWADTGGSTKNRADALLMKPIRISDLAKAVRKVLDEPR